MDDKDLFEQLRSGPLPRNGFDDALRRKINENLDNSRRGTKRPSFLRFSAVGASFLVVVGVVVAVWSWNGFGGREAEKLSEPTEQASPSQSQAQSELGDPTPHSAVVIGLRKDYAGDERSSYRTLVVAAENERLTQIGTGEGIWMPYKTTFYKIEPVDDSLGKGTQKLIANKRGKRAESSGGESSPGERRTEKLLYAGDKYVSVLETTNADAKGQTVEESRVIVNLLPSLEETARAGNGFASLDAANVSLGAALGTETEETDVDRWTVARENNAWVAKRGESDGGLIRDEDIPAWPTIGIPLERTPVVKDEPLAISWADVRKFEPNATDAYTSQDEDIAMIVSDGKLTFVPYRLPEAERTPMTVDLEAGETVVMVQWAIQENYAKNWRNWFREWFAPSAR